MILHTILVRPYVFVFLIAFLIISILSRGWRKTLFFLLSGYLIAWASEASSIRTGFPYGWYFYKYENLQGEWLNLGVPVWDSLSYTFLCFAGMSLAEFVLVGARSPRPNEGRGNPAPTRLALLSALFVMILDIIVDPLAHLGSQWFLGDIYYYLHPGFYFNVPVSNFIGWFFVAFAIVRVNGWFGEKIEQDFAGARLPRPNDGQGNPAPTHSQLTSWLARYGGIGLYFGVFLFNLLITLWIHAWALALCDLLFICIPFSFLLQKSTKTS